MFVYANEPLKDNETMQINANKIDQNGTIITATGDILVFSPTYYITANKIIYDKNTSIMELFGNVNISKNNTNISLSEYAFLDMKNEINSATPILFFDKTSNIWISAKKIEKKKDLNIIKNATLSSCDCENPTWSVGFKSGDYNTTDQWINLYNNTLYIKDIPAWYFLIPAIPYASVPSLVTAYLVVKAPYLGFSTNTQRRSGLLRPQIGYGQEDGFFYAQPIYYAPRKDVDFEYIPQIRLLRGNGHELKIRYVDSAYSKFDFESGIFTEKDSYFQEQNLINKEHYGWNLKYDRVKVFSKENATDGLYASLQDMNDVEFLNTKYSNNNAILAPDKILESKIKYFYNTQKYNINGEVVNYNNIDYAGTIENNDDNVTQITPALNFHKYTNSLFLNKLTNSLDVKYKRQHRVVGLGGETIDVALPFSYSTYFLNDYLLFTYEKSFNLNHIKYLNNDNNLYNDGTLIKGTDSVSLEVDLLKPFETKIHTLNFATKYIKPKHIKQEGEMYGITSKPAELSIFPYTKESENINLSFNQTLYDRKSLNPYISHKMNQSIVFDDNGSSKLGHLENELAIYFPYATISNRLFFNHDEKLIVSSISALQVNKNSFFLTAEYSFSRDDTGAPANFLYKNLSTVESITGHIGNKVFKYYTLGYKEQYDLTNHTSKLKEYKLDIDKKCWALGLSFQDSLVATATNTDRARRQNIVYATITLKPILSFNQKYIQNEREE